MFTIQVEARFEAAHFLRTYRGGAEPLHGHSYRVVAELASREGKLDGDDIAVDFEAATRELGKVAQRLDYKCINDVVPFDTLSPTAENIARWFFDELTVAITAEGAQVRAITVWEGPFSSVRYEPVRESERARERESEK
jgi:6-pyruvoyltetrahydropterin/6-carboxytetrahydropterin synthase